MPLPVLAGASFVLALLGMLAGRSGRDAGLFALGAFVIGPAWLILVSVALRRHGTRALWTVLGFPFALRATGQFLLLALACLTSSGCL